MNRTKLYSIKWITKQEVIKCFLGNDKYNNFVYEFSSKLYNLKTDMPFSDYIFLCIGSDKIIGDSYGPLVGEKLKKLFKNMYNNIKIYGTLEEPISAINLDITVKEIYKKYKHPCIIAIDSALGMQEKIGTIVISNTKMQCGKGILKNIAYIGDISIKGIVGKNYKLPKHNFSVLQNTSLGKVIKLADITADRNL